VDYFELNKQAWDKRVDKHVASEFYDVDGFLSGRSSLQEIELAELGDVNGKRLLHLQCHFGLDTLSWARMGAVATGVDLSPAAIEQANRLKTETELDARFVCSDVYSYAEEATPDHDIVYTSYGAVCWLPCLDRWARTIDKSLKCGGTFYMVEFHPLYDLVSGYSYFHNPQPDVEEEATYTENNDDEKASVAVWTHPLSDVINALIRINLQIEFVNEFPYSPYNCFEGLEEKQKGRYFLSKSGQDVPLLYSIKATKPA
jgi:SAM-dependent methyltransferase